jgi:hypothetical protein
LFSHSPENQVFKSISSLSFFFRAFNHACSRTSGCITLAAHAETDFYVEKNLHFSLKFFETREEKVIPRLRDKWVNG